MKQWKIICHSRRLRGRTLCARQLLAEGRLVAASGVLWWAFSYVWHRHYEALS